MISANKQSLFQKEWTGEGERGFRDFLLIPAIFFGAVSPGLFISALLTGYTAGLWISLAMNFAGYGITHLLFLGRMERFWRAILNVKTSWISRGFLFNALFSIFGLLVAVAESGIAPALGGAPFRSVLILLGLASAVLFAAYPGFMLSIVKAIPFWRSTLEPVIFFLQGLLGGIALQVLLMPAASGTAAVPLIKVNFALALLVLLLFMAALLVKALHGGTEKTSVEFLTRGEFSSIFLGGAIAAGLVVPVFAIAAGLLVPFDFQEFKVIYYVAMAMELAGIYLGKYSILRAGAYSPFR